jgi:aspartyl-tRNA(Asn)/glutamyl-tRNA(Gln) amidotransferase subunit A
VKRSKPGRATAIFIQAARKPLSHLSKFDRPTESNLTGILGRREELFSGQISSFDLVENCLSRIANPEGEGKRTFIKVWNDQARTVARAQDDLRRAGYAPSSVAGIPISIKDLFDVRGETTLAGTKALDDAAPATADAPVVKRLKAAGAVLVGRTNMTQFAFSAVGINPYFGTPGNPWDRSRIPGGSSSGTAVSVADGMAMAAIGSDTVGSIRVPAALCGVVGFRPTQHKVPREGAIPLSTTLDSIGPLARTVEDCALVHAVIAGEEYRLPDFESPRDFRLVVPTNVVIDDMDDDVSRAFERACAVISEAGAVVSELPIDLFSDIQSRNLNATIQAVEALAWHRELLARRGNDYDAKVKARVERGAQITAVDYVRALGRRVDLISAFHRFTAPFDALILPTVPIIAPTMDECARNEDGIRARLIRNPSLFNLLDRPAISIPIQRVGDAPVGLMIVGQRDGDWRLLGIARAIEALFPAKI